MLTWLLGLEAGWSIPCVVAPDKNQNAIINGESVRPARGRSDYDASGKGLRCMPSEFCIAGNIFVGHAHSDELEQ